MIRKVWIFGLDELKIFKKKKVYIVYIFNNIYIWFVYNNDSFKSYEIWK